MTISIGFGMGMVFGQLVRSARMKAAHGVPAGGFCLRGEVPA
jgi:hypothetical protein